ncbi:MFS transporter [Kibdelosporangium phytohabitans]|uniref:MFS transporter n=2 Tax=Kibdelosporangium phytohabitans TaxID=860235 RepID=A0A0N9IGD2_9PSEU|nr:MFS transporter [Kibdelosporangium phytohabitans]ALG15557.1 MFS transporter [Kibdelosporangium phytohabitans]
MFMAILDSYIAIVAGPAIQSDLRATDGELQWVLASYQLAYAVFMITAGRIADLHGRKRLFMLGIVVFTLASIACAVAPSPGVLVAARIVQGLGAAMAVPQVFGVITLLVPPAGRHRVFGVLGVVMGLATIGGQLIGGVLVGADLFGSGWRAVFWVNVPIGIVTLLLAAKYVPESKAAGARRLDVPGVAVLTAALFLLTFPLIQGQEAGWPWWTWACFAASLVAFATFVFIERRVGDPLMNLALFRLRSFSLGLVLVICVYALLSSYYLALSVSLQDGLGLSALESGLVYVPTAVVFFISGLVAGRLAPKYGRRVLEAGSIIVTIGYLSAAVLLLTIGEMTPGLVVPTLMLQGLGGGLLITPLLNSVLARIEPDAVGMASGALSTAQQVGAALGVAVVGAVFFTSFRPDVDGPAQAAGHGFAAASLGVFVIAVIVTGLVFLLPRTRVSR